MPLKIEREGETIETSITLAAELTAYVRPLLGILPMRTAADGEPAEGVGVRFVLPESPAASAQVERGDRIVAVNGAAITDAAQLADVVGHYRADDVLAIEVVRDGQPRDVEVTLAAMTGELPDTLPTVEIPVPESKADAFPATGRFVDTLGGDDARAYWAYVPSGYNPAYAVWSGRSGCIRPATRWRPTCWRHGNRTASVVG